MLSKGDRDFLDHAVEADFLLPQDEAEILADHADMEAFFGRPVPIEHVLYARQWLAPAQVDRVRAATRHHVLLCPNCFSRLNIITLKPGQCCSCRTANCHIRLRVPRDPHADLMDRVEQADRADRADRVNGPQRATAGRGRDVARAASAADDPATAREQRLRTDFSLRGFTLVEPAGEGGQATVYKGIQHPLQRTVAIKIVEGSIDDRRPALRRFYREAREQARIEHPNVVRMYHAGWSNGFHYLILQWIDGGDLRRRVEEKGPLPPVEALKHVIEAAEGLAAAHTLGLVHRDVKPSNLLLARDDTTYVTDFGLVRRLNPGKASTGITEDGQILGTLGYMAPEQLHAAREATPASDIFALGATLYHLLAGRPPFADMPPTAIVLRLSQGRMPRLDAPGLRLPQAVVDLVHRMMAHDPGERPASATAAVRELRAVLATVHGSPAADTRRRRRDRDTKVPEMD